MNAYRLNALRIDKGSMGNACAFILISILGSSLLAKELYNPSLLRMGDSITGLCAG